jgi:glycosyltransferase involved in cell wall biosynthesis
MHLFDVLIVCYDDDARLSVTLNSLLRQNFKGRVVIQDGSLLDATSLLIAEYPLLDIDHAQEKDHGLYDAMNRGVKRVRSDYFLTLNCGDQLLVSSVKSNIFDVNAVCIFCTAVLEFNNGVKVNFHPNLSNLRSYMSCCHQAIIIQKKYFELSGGYDLKYKIAADYDFVSRVVASSEVILVSPEKVSVFEADNGLSQKYRFLLERETATIKSVGKTFFFKMLVFFIHFGRFVKFKALLFLNLGQGS